jgi:DNA-binding NarL/FixJ family response regulator
MVSTIRLLICHQNRLFRESLVLALAGIDDMEIMVMDGPSLEAIPPPRQDGLDLLLIEASLPDMAAFRLIESLRRTGGAQAPRTILLASSSSELIQSCLRAGAHACVHEDDTLADLRQALENVLQGRSYCSPQIACRLFAQTEEPVRPNCGSGGLPECELTPRQMEVLRMASRALSNKQIARELHLSIHTVKNHFHSIFEKLNVEDRLAAVRLVARRGLLEEREAAVCRGVGPGFLG